jgi:hypothetical protein
MTNAAFLSASPKRMLSLACKGKLWEIWKYGGNCKCGTEIGNYNFQVVSSLALEGYKALSILWVRSNQCQGLIAKERYAVPPS